MREVCTLCAFDRAGAYAAIVLACFASAPCFCHATRVGTIRALGHALRVAEVGGVCALCACSAQTCVAIAHTCLANAACICGATGVMGDWASIHTIALVVVLGVFALHACRAIRASFAMALATLTYTGFAIIVARA